MMSIRTLAAVLTAVTHACGTASADEDIGELVELCVSCHGEDGRPIEPDYPIIDGQQFLYLYIQLKDFQSGLRANEVMEANVADLSDDQLKALAWHFAGRPWPSMSFPSTDQDRALGQRMASGGQCPQCHLGGYEGNNNVARLVGQQPRYLERTMLEYKNGVRMNAPDKATLMRGFEDADITGMANYLAGF
jgi:cytochrome c553